MSDYESLGEFIDDIRAMVFALSTEIAELKSRVAELEKRGMVEDIYREE